jgi:hypothetical protein
LERRDTSDLKLRPMRCPWCRNEHGFSSIGGSSPQEAGQYVICSACNWISKFNAHLALVKVQAAELIDMDDQTRGQIWNVQHAYTEAMNGNA